jgi:hypothetical protein
MHGETVKLPVSVFTNVDHTGVIPESNPDLLNKQPAFSFLSKSANFVKLKRIYHKFNCILFTVIDYSSVRLFGSPKETQVFLDSRVDAHI